MSTCGGRHQKRALSSLRYWANHRKKSDIARGNILFNQLLWQDTRLVGQDTGSGMWMHTYFSIYLTYLEGCWFVLTFSFSCSGKRIMLKKLFEHWECQKGHTLPVQTSFLSPWVSMNKYAQKIPEHVWRNIDLGVFFQFQVTGCSLISELLMDLFFVSIFLGFTAFCGS